MTLSRLTLNMSRNAIDQSPTLLGQWREKVGRVIPRQMAGRVRASLDACGAECECQSYEAVSKPVATRGSRVELLEKNAARGPRALRFETASWFDDGADAIMKQEDWLDAAPGGSRRDVNCGTEV
jgi:hypothetical protein